MEEKIRQIFKTHDLSYEYWVCEGDCVVIAVEWGDWKHDHGYLNYIMRENGFSLLSEQVTEEDGSDCYSSEHIYKLNKQAL